ncbi:DDE family transposase [Paraburkholderia sp. BL6665CI2N2]|nr:DDE family transposase [Paraburkholderia sp. BL6665CI2N2]
MKARIAVDVESGLVHTVKCTPANVHDITVAHELLHGKEQVAFADTGYVGIEKRGETGAVQRYAAMRPSKRNKLDKRKRLDRIYNKIERLKAGVRAKAEHPFRVLKCQFGCEGAISEAGKEHDAHRNAVRPGRPVDGAQDAVKRRDKGRKCAA